MIRVLLYYKYISVNDPEGESIKQRALCQKLGLLGRIIIGTEGINGTVAGSTVAINKYILEMNQHALFNGIDYKQDQHHEVPFNKLIVKVRDEIVTLGTEADAARGGTKLSPEEFNKMLDDPQVVLFDARNNYESAIGRFKGAITPNIKLFKELPDAISDYEGIKDKKVVTYCTGGIRCEKASALMKEQGFKNVHQLDGGIIKYAQAFPEGAFEGHCFVFDRRMSVSFKDDPESLGACHFCQTATYRYQNCSNARCNDLILVCDQCQSGGRNICSVCTTKALELKVI